MGSDHSKSIIYTNLNRFLNDFISLAERFLAPKKSFSNLPIFRFLGQKPTF
jgi:hypothetical protein